MYLKALIIEIIFVIRRIKIRCKTVGITQIQRLLNLNTLFESPDMKDLVVFSDIDGVTNGVDVVALISASKNQIGLANSFLEITPFGGESDGNCVAEVSAVTTTTSGDVNHFRSIPFGVGFEESRDERTNVNFLDVNFIGNDVFFNRSNEIGLVKRLRNVGSGDVNDGGGGVGETGRSKDQLLLSFSTEEIREVDGVVLGGGHFEGLEVLVVLVGF